MTDPFKPNCSPGSDGQLRSGRENSASAWGWGVLLLFFCMLWGVGVNPCWGAQNSKARLSFLVARLSMVDPIFQHSVVLMLPLEGQPLIVGLIINKPTRLPLIKLFPENLALKYRSEIAYMGGPVDLASGALVFHAPKPPKQAMLLGDDIYLSFDAKLISRLLHDPKQTGDLRLFLGRAQWAPEQLRDEALEGSWYSLQAEGDVIFDRDSEHLWNRLHARARPPLSVENHPAQTSSGQFRVASYDSLP